MPNKMALVQRNQPTNQQHKRTHTSINNSSSTLTQRKIVLSPRGVICYTITLLLVFLAITWKVLPFLSKFPSRSPNEKHIKGGYQLVGKDGHYTISIKFVDDESNHGLRTTSSSQQGDDGILVVSSLGPHKVVVQTHCDCPPIWMRIVGDGLVPIPLIQQMRQQKEGYEDWAGEFTLPMEGQYKLEERWYGCGNEKRNVNPSSYDSTDGLDFRVIYGAGEGSTENSPNVNDSNLPSSIFGTGAWISSKKVEEDNDANKEETSINDYVWANPQSVIDASITLLNYELDEGDGAITKHVFAKEAQHEFYSFSELGNYELVCWIGSQSAKELRSTFLAIRPHINSGQRPFKFHYYEATSFTNPDATWGLETKKGFRKCKHVLVSLDEVKNPTSSAETGADEDAKSSQLSKDEYRTQLITFINHLTKAIDDDTFPIWIFTVMQPPMEATNCHSTVANESTIAGPEKKNSEHPCNIILKDLFSEHKESSSTSPMFPSRVRLLDNSDLSLPQWDRLGHSNVIAAAALRIFVLVGHGVKNWRDVGQRGGIKGLERNGTLEPNFELVPYDWS